ncbi:VOC family protein [Sphingomonas sp.]|jgi:catechol 2,3-dioxygenase-like lactoylglutathione lyase family enzyme|uniref:VOC family protein n=1 Tax=Sphingomonas sp. TaxID=28214 RepID=UPI002637C4FF|nr:VOC family protein [Sphingomonas sp.]MDF2494837.1 Glyoxalase/bleomycin resistance protein/dioxygenase [Sphingomonas sp.]
MPAPARLIVNLDVPDLARAETFYCRALGLRVGRRIGAAAVELLGLEAPLYLLEQADGSVACDTSPVRRDYRRHWTPVHLDIAVDDLDTARAAAIAAGAVDETGVRAAPYGRIAGFADPFGHGFCLIEFNERGYDAIVTGEDAG